MRFLITGGAGFLGSALAHQLVSRGHQVRVLDDLSAGDPAGLDQRVLFTRGDVRDIPRLWTLLQGVDCVYHLAARVSVSESILYPRDYNDINVGGTVSVMEAMRDAGVRRVVYAGGHRYVFRDLELEALEHLDSPGVGTPDAAKVTGFLRDYVEGVAGPLPAAPGDEAPDPELLRALEAMGYLGRDDG